MMTLISYTTDSGSEYGVKTNADGTFVHRSKLGDKHVGEARAHRLAEDGIDTEWQKVDSVINDGVGTSLLIINGDRFMRTNRVTQIKVVE
jgi:hypothetical protein